MTELHVTTLTHDVLVKFFGMVWGKRHERPTQIFGDAAAVDAFWRIIPWYGHGTRFNGALVEVSSKVEPRTLYFRNSNFPKNPALNGKLTWSL